MRLFRKHVLSVISLSVLVLALFSLLSYEITNKHIDDAKKERVTLLAEVVTNGLKSIMMEGRPKEEFQRFLDGLAAEDIKAVRVFSDRGSILSSTIPGEVGKVVDAQHLQSFKSHKDNAIFIHKSQGINVYSSIMVMSNDWPCQRCHGAGDEIRAIVDLEVMQGTMDGVGLDFARWIIVAFLSSSGIFSLGFIFINRFQIRRPFEKMTAEIRSLAEGRAAARVSLSGAYEFDALATTVNRVAEDFEKAKTAVRLLESREMSQLEKMASIGEVAATVAHEIKNPLAGISGAIQVMAEDIPDNSPRKEICNEILSEIDRLDRSVKELIAFARPQEINPVSIDLNAVVKKAVSEVTAAAESIGIEVNLFPETLPDVFADPDQLEKVIRDVMLYQMQLMSDGGAITISTEYDPEKDEAEIVSADTARALSADKIKNIFRPSFSTKNTGTGLGLAVGRNIIESHEGRIRVESEPGTGNSFHIIIPGKRQ